MPNTTSRSGKSATSSQDRCLVCGLVLHWQSTGRPARYCGPTCRSRAHRRRVADAASAAALTSCFACLAPHAGSDGLCLLCRESLDAVPLVSADGRPLVDQLPADLGPAPTSSRCCCGLCPDSTEAADR